MPLSITLSMNYAKPLLTMFARSWSSTLNTIVPTIFKQVPHPPANACINMDTICPLLATAERYIPYKSTKMFMQRVST